MFTSILASCPGGLRIHSDFVPTGSFRLAQVTSIAKRDEITQISELYEAIKSSGVDDSEIVDGSVVLARIYCCGGITENTSSEVVNARMLFVPKELQVGLGDVVEVRVGNPPEDSERGQLNTVTRIVQKYESEAQNCWWDPKDDRLWLRVLYCDWLPEEGWVKQGGNYPAWYKATP